MVRTPFDITALPRGYQIGHPLVQLDTVRGQGVAVVSHAHSDHAPENARTTVVTTPETAALLRVRGYNGGVETLSYDSWCDVEGGRLKLLPAGHMLGSAMVLIERADGRRLLYTGDMKTRRGRTAEPARFESAHELVTECTFGLPIFRFPPQELVELDMVAFARGTLERGGVPVFAGYSIGKGQELLAILAAHGVPTLAGFDIWTAARVYQTYGYAFPEARPDSAAARGDQRAWVMTPTEAATACARVPGARLCYASGWALLSARRAGMRATHMAPLSDHADYYDLLELVAALAPEHVWTVHGPYAGLFARDLTRRLAIAAAPLVAPSRERQP